MLSSTTCCASLLVLSLDLFYFSNIFFRSYYLRRPSHSADWQRNAIFPGFVHCGSYDPFGVNNRKSFVIDSLRIAMTNAINAPKYATSTAISYMGSNLYIGNVLLYSTALVSNGISAATHYNSKRLCVLLHMVRARVIIANGTYLFSNIAMTDRPHLTTLPRRALLVLVFCAIPQRTMPIAL